MDSESEEIALLLQQCDKMEQSGFAFTLLARAARTTGRQIPAIAARFKDDNLPPYITDEVCALVLCLSRVQSRAPSLHPLDMPVLAALAFLFQHTRATGTRSLCRFFNSLSFSSPFHNAYSFAPCPQATCVYVHASVMVHLRFDDTKDGLPSSELLAKMGLGSAEDNKAQDYLVSGPCLFLFLSLLSLSFSSLLSPDHLL